MIRRSLLALSFITLALPALAQTYPTRTISMVIPFPPGGNELGKALGQTVIIVNKGGAAGTLGMNDIVKAQGDGYTIGLSPNNTLTAQPHLHKLAYGMDSFRYICLTYYAPYVLVAGPQARAVLVLGVPLDPLRRPGLRVPGGFVTGHVDAHLRMRGGRQQSEGEQAGESEATGSHVIGNDAVPKTLRSPAPGGGSGGPATSSWR